MKSLDGKEIYSITEVNYFAKQTLEQISLWVEGEISACRKNPNYNFYYLDLKDQKALLPAIADGYMLEELGDEIIGQKVLVFGNLSLYEPYGKYQFRIARVEAAGEGILQKKLEELIKKLKAEGLFEKKHKIQIPKYPKRVCLVTSKDSDAYNDFVRHSAVKFPIIELYTADTRVQGKNAIKSLLNTLSKVDKLKFDVVVITRGGGSLEDLAAFNDEIVARAIFKMNTPTVVAIGHETNESLAEWVADLRASTPTDAAHKVTEGYTVVLEQLENLKYHLSSKSTHYFSTSFQKLDHLYFSLQQLKISFKDLPHRLGSVHEKLRRHEKYTISDNYKMLRDIFIKMKKTIKFTVEKEKNELYNFKNSLNLLSPQNTLMRGYSITQNSKGRIVRSLKNVVVGETIGVKLADGSIKSKVKSKQWLKKERQL